LPQKLSSFRGSLNTESRTKRRVIHCDKKAQAMKILHLIDSGGLYGAEQMLLALTEEQIKQGLQPIILSCGLPNEVDKALEIEAKKRNIPVIKWRMKAGLNFKGAWQILKLAKKEQIDILHSHGYKFNILFAIFPKFIRKIPFITTVHGYVHAKTLSANGVYQFLDKLSLKKMNRVIFVSKKTQKDFVSLKKYNIILNGICNIPMTKNLQTKRFDGDTVKILAIGRLAVEKGFDYLLKAVSEANKAGKKITVDIMGTGKEKEKLLHLVKELNINEEVNFLGFIENPSQYFNSYDLLLMPSLTEGLPITILEALREKLPVLASNVGEIPFVINGLYPLIDRDNDLNSLYRNICDFERFYISKGEEANLKLYNQFIEKYTAKNMANGYKKVYEKLLGGGVI